VRKPSDIDRIADQESIAFRRRQAMTFLECAINLLAHDYRPEEVADILRTQARMLEEWG